MLTVPQAGIAMLMHALFGILCIAVVTASVFSSKSHGINADFLVNHTHHGLVANKVPVVHTSCCSAMFDGSPVRQCLSAVAAPHDL